MKEHAFAGIDSRDQRAALAELRRVPAGSAPEIQHSAIANVHLIDDGEHRRPLIERVVRRRVDHAGVPVGDGVVAEFFVGLSMFQFNNFRSRSMADNDTRNKSGDPGDTDDSVQKELSREEGEGADSIGDVGENRTLSGSSSWETLPDGEKSGKDSGNSPKQDKK